jgi:hypothetical protein
VTSTGAGESREDRELLENSQERETRYQYRWMREALRHADWMVGPAGTRCISVGVSAN